MAASPCPECENALGTMIDRSVADRTVELDFECTGCGHTWSNPL